MLYEPPAANAKPEIARSMWESRSTRLNSNAPRCGLAVLAVALLQLPLAPPALADEDARDREFFESKIRPILVEHCNECHSGSSRTLQGGLRVDFREGLRTGGDSGPAVVPGNVDESLVIAALRYEGLEMPPSGKLSEAVIADFVEWIERGAHDPREGTATAAKPAIDLEAGREFWSFRPLTNPKPPKVQGNDWPAGDIDRFLHAKIESAGIAPAPDAEKAILLRRVYFDLTGLPPTPDEIEAFNHDKSPDAYAKLVDRLLASPRFGERWGRHWLDVARYSETTGGGRSMFFGSAWRYRDYVINAFNNDKPYDQFIIEQLAGDQLPYDDYRQGQEQLIATAFLAMGPINYEEQDKAQLRMDVIDEQIDATGRAFLAMTLGCARCHDHKFDPIPTADYYALAGIFGSTQSLIDDNVSTWVTRSLPLDPETAGRLDEHKRQLARTKERIDDQKRLLDQILKYFPVITLDDKQAKFVGNWSESASVKPFVGSAYRYASGNASAIYELGGRIEPGEYKVRVSYTPNPNRSGSAVIKVAHAGGEDQFELDQTKPPKNDGLYEELGSFRFESESNAQVVVTAREGGRVVVADAVQLIPLFRRTTPQATAGRIVSDLAEFDGIVVDDVAAEKTGHWTESKYTPAYVGSGYVHDDNADKGTKSITFRADLPRSGEYEVRLAYVPAEGRATKVPVSISYSGGDQTVLVNERLAPPIDGLFVSLGSFPFANDQTAIVTVSTTGTEDGHVTADAVQFLPMNARPASKPGAKDLEGDSLATIDPVVAQQKMAAIETEITQLKNAMNKLEKSAPPSPPEVMSIKDAETIADCEICIRGVHKNRGAAVPRGVLSVIGSTTPPRFSTDASGRLELARWIASPENPLTARVMVNRIWQHLFGVGIVPSVDNFGIPGERPTHPELLDFLAQRFIDNGWSMKSIIRDIVLSHAYRLSSERSPAQIAADPANHLFAAQNRRRLEAEAIYDSMLMFGGNLDLSMGGDTIRPGTKTEYGYSFDVGRRAVYLPVLRNQMPDLFAVFDFPDPNLSVGRRNRSTLATQALYLMNSPFVAAQAERAAKRLLDAEGLDDADRLRFLYLRALGREPSEKETDLAERFLATPAGEYDARLRAWTGLCQAIMSCIDFRYVQ